MRVLGFGLGFLCRRWRRGAASLAAPLAMGLVMALAVARAAVAQGAGAVSYVYLVGTDTIAVETLAPGAGTVRGTLAYRGQPRMEWEQQRAPVRLTLRVFAANADAAAAPLQSVVFMPRGDSMVAELSGGGRTRTQVFASKAGAMPLINTSVLHAALLTQYARASGLTALPLFLTAGAATVESSVEFSGDSVSTITIANTPMRITWDGGVPRELVSAPQRLRVVRATTAVAPLKPETFDYRAPADAPYVAVNVSIPTSRGYALAGTLTKPNGVARAPVVVTVSGSGPQERDERLGAVMPGYALFREVADTLGRRGVAVLRYDDRGVGESGGADSRAKATSADFADDVESVVAYLRTRADIDSTRIFIAGHSEGGFIAPMVAARDHSIRGIALLAGTAYNGRRILEFQLGSQLKSKEAANRMIDSLRADPWTAYFVKADPLPTLRQVRQPVLVLQGDTDHQVTPEQADTIAATLRRAGNRRVTLRHFPATNHLFLADPSGLPNGYASLPDSRVRPAVLSALADWVVALTR